MILIQNDYSCVPCVCISTLWGLGYVCTKWIHIRLYFKPVCHAESRVWSNWEQNANKTKLMSHQLVLVGNAKTVATSLNLKHGQSLQSTRWIHQPSLATVRMWILFLEEFKMDFCEFVNTRISQESSCSIRLVQSQYIASPYIKTWSLHQWLPYLECFDVLKLWYTLKPVIVPDLLVLELQFL